MSYKIFCKNKEFFYTDKIILDKIHNKKEKYIIHKKNAYFNDILKEDMES